MWDSTPAELGVAKQGSGAAGVAASPAVDAASRATVSRLRDLVALAKPRVTKLVLVTAGVGFALAALGQSWTAWTLAWAGAVCMVGTALSAAGANALNQAIERAQDACMARTADRPVPAGRLSQRAAAWTGIGLSVAGVASLSVVSAAAGGISAATILIYVFGYTPMKSRTPWATALGAVPGALPPMIGWTAASAAIGHDAAAFSPAGWSLFAILFFWQMPHFFAIAWMYREEYAGAGYRVLAAVDPTGRRTARATLLWLGALLPVSAAPALLMPNLLGSVYLTVAAALGAAFVITALRFSKSRSRSDARRVFFASIIYLPALLLAMVAEAAFSALL